MRERERAKKRIRQSNRTKVKYVENKTERKRGR
jgi:hypothetical protein